MYLSSLKIQNYRSLKDVNIPLSPFVCIIGENNCGKSSTLLGLSLFINGTKISKKEYHNPSRPILIEVDLNCIQESDLERISEKHRERIVNIMEDDKLTLIRKYETNGVSKVYYKGIGPINEKLVFDTLKKSEKLKGKKGKELQEFMKNYLEEYKDNFNEVNIHKDVENVLGDIINGLSSEELEEKDFLLPTGIWNSLKPLLPDPLLIPAVKNISDDLKTRESATFGKLLGALLGLIEDTDVIKAISESFDELTGLLNKIKSEDGSVVDGRIDEVKYIENIFEKYIQENFPSVTLELMIPPPTLKNIFSGAEIEVNDGISGPFEFKGDGLKRAITFALLRTYVEVSKTNKIGEKKEITPYLFLFEEPELYLHPKAQKILFNALNQISEPHQVVVTTHSPIFFSPEYGGTFIKMKKNDNPIVPCSESCGITINDDLDELELFRLICFENNNAAFFSDRILLVEGDSDLIFFPHVSKVLNENWDFDLKNIPIIKMAGKGNVKRYRDFFEMFGIDVHSILDLDVIVKGFNKLGVSEAAVNLQNELIQVIDEIAEQKEISGSPKKEHVKEMIRSYSWVERYTRLKELAEIMMEGYFLKEEEKLEIEYLFAKEIYNVRKEVLKDYDGDLKTNLLNSLRDEQIYVLYNGSVESYYPEEVTGRNKLVKAFNACELLTAPEQINQLCPYYTVEASSLSEFEVIFSNIFDNVL